MLPRLSVNYRITIRLLYHWYLRLVRLNWSALLRAVHSHEGEGERRLSNPSVPLWKTDVYWW
jgi:hypothetical protein